MNWFVFSKHVMVAILDSAGHRLRRYTIAPQLVGLVLSALVVISLLLLVFTYYIFADTWLAKQATNLQRQNRRLQQHIHTMEQRLPAITQIHERNQTMVRALSSKSGLDLALQEADKSQTPLVTEVDPIGSLPLSPWAIEPKISSHLVPVRQFLRPALALLQQQVHQLEIVLSDTLDYFRDADNLLASTPSIRPAKTPWLTSSFGTRKDPIFHYWIMHKGLDLGGYKGMPIYAPADGTVIWTGRRGGYGLTVVIDHGYGLQTHFAHLSRYRVDRGDIVRRGDLIAEMGSTGKSTGPHLHYEVRRHGQPLDPRRFILD